MERADVHVVKDGRELDKGEETLEENKAGNESNISFNECSEDYRARVMTSTSWIKVEERKKVRKVAEVRALARRAARRVTTRSTRMSGAPARAKRVAKARTQIIRADSKGMDDMGE